MLAKADEEGTVCIQQGRQPEKQVSRALREWLQDTQTQEVKTTLMMTKTSKIITN